MTPSNEDLEREFEPLLRNPVTRRRILQRGAAGALSGSALAYLAACGTDEPPGGGGQKAEEGEGNDQLFGKVRQQYDQGSSGGRDIHVVTDWMADRMIRLGYVQKFDKAAMPNASANVIDRLKSPPFDPKREFSMPWQSGLTGII